MLDPLPRLTLALALATLFAAACVHKMRSREQWAGVLGEYRLLPERFVGAGTRLIPLLEALAAGLLLWPPARTAGALFATTLLIGYATALAINLRRGRTSIDCGCFGSQRVGIAPWMVGRNLVLTLFCLALLLPASPRTLTPLELIFAPAFVATLALLYPVLEIALQPAPSTFDDNARASRLPLAPAARGGA